MTRAIALKEAGDSCQSLGKGHDKGYLPWKMAGDAGQSLEKGNDKGYCFEKRLEKAMTRAIALRKGQALPV